MRGIGRPNYLFNGRSVFDLNRFLVDRAVQGVKSFPEDRILSFSTDDLVQQAVEDAAVDFPKLDVSGVYVEELEEIHAHPGDFGRGPYTARARIVAFHVPFRGDPGLLQTQPSRSSLPGPEADLEGNELIIRISADGGTADKVRAEFDARIKQIEEHLTTLAHDMQGVPQQVQEAARYFIEPRRQQLLASKSLVASLGFPMKRREGMPETFRAPEVKHRVSRPQARPAVTKSFEPEPALPEEEYQHILSVMDNMTKVMERSPATFKEMGEEDIRQHFLVQLNGHYEGQATGETFNHSGKTDILIRSGDRNIFVAECKFWTGEKAFLATLDQLVSYLTWRDSKAAAVIFNRNKNLGSVLTTIKGAVPRHPLFKRGPTVEGETRLRYVMANANDPEREVTVTVLVYDIPT